MIKHLRRWWWSSVGFGIKSSMRKMMMMLNGGKQEDDEEEDEPFKGKENGWNYYHKTDEDVDDYHQDTSFMLMIK